MTHGQKTVQLHDRTKSPFSFQFSGIDPRYPSLTGQRSTTAEMMIASPSRQNSAPSARLKRAVVMTFSVAMMAPSIAIQNTLITPIANISSIMAQQQPRQ